jgi:O-antigen ligase
LSEAARLTVSSPEAMRAARRARAAGQALEAVLWSVLFGSALTFGAVHPWAFPPFWIACLFAGLVAGIRVLAQRDLRRTLGPQVVAFHVSGRWLVADPDPDDGAVAWSIDLRRSRLPCGPLVLPGVAFLVLVALQLVPIPGGPVSIEPEATRRGGLFALSLLALHEAAAIAFVDRGARRRFRRAVLWLGVVLASVAVAQSVSGARRIYGLFEPWESTAFFGPFVNRNHFAGYMLMIVPVGLGLLSDAARAYARRTGERPNLRRRLVALSTREGTRLVFTAVALLGALAGLVATLSRGALLALAGSLGIAGVVDVKRRAPAKAAWAMGAGALALLIACLGIERFEERFRHAASDTTGRTAIWRESLSALRGSRWITGYGLDTFATALSRVPAWRLPEGASPWPAPVRSALESHARSGYRAPTASAGVAWYREAHNDYVQLLVETGLAGLTLAAWGIVATLRAVRYDPWVLAAIVGVLLHVIVDFDLQIPALAALFVTLAALSPDRAGDRRPGHFPAARARSL